MNSQASVWSVILLVAGAGACGCDQVNQAVVQPAVEEATAATMRQDLAATGLAFHYYHDSYNQGPPGWDEFIAFADGTDDLNAAAIRRVRDDGYQMQWNVRIRDATEGASNFVLARKPGDGPRLMLDGSVQ